MRPALLPPPESVLPAPDLVAAHGPRVYAMCVRLASDPDDCYQEIWEKVLGAIARFDPSGSASVATWIATIARRHLIDRHRRRVVRGEVVSIAGLPSTEPAIDEAIAQRQQHARVEAALPTARCLFLQGAAGDLSVKPPPGSESPKAFGEALAGQVLGLRESIRAEPPADPSIAARSETIRFGTRVDLTNPLVLAAFGRAFFPELVASTADEHARGVEAEVNAVLLNGKVAIVAGSGEFFCDHANRLRERSGFEATLFVGYCNGHHMYFPTIEAAIRGGYGAEPGTSLAELGAGERLMDRALIGLYRLQGRLAAERKD